MTILAPDHDDLHHRLARTRGVVLVMFTAVGCGSCRRMRAALAECPDLPTIEIDAGIDQALANEFDVFHLPALFVYRDGRYHGPLAVESTPARIEAGLAALLAQPAQDPP
jgi:thiol-disulfide isomerase/thioredoxin